MTAYGKYQTGPRSTQKHILYGRKLTPYMKELREYVKRIKEVWQAKMKEIEQRRAETYRARKKKGAGRFRISAGERR